MLEGLSGFLMNPGLALGGLAVASPILVHLLSRRRFRRVRWAAMEFLLEAQRKNRRRIQLEQFILLLLRCLAVLLLAAVAARPFVAVGGWGGWLGAGARTQRLFLLDDSFSMEHRLTEGGKSVFNKAVAAVKTLTQAIAEQSPHDTFTLALMSRPHLMPLTAADLTAERLPELLDRLDGMHVSQRAGRLAESLKLLSALASQETRQANTAVYVVSDFQRRDWLASSREEGASNEGVLEPLRSLFAAGATITLLDVAASDPGNVALTDLRCTVARPVAGVTVRFEVEVSNFSPRAAESVDLMPSIGGYTLPPVHVARVAAGQSIRQLLEVTFPEEGSSFLSVTLAGPGLKGDGVTIDNTRQVAVEVAPALRILMVDGQPSHDPYRDEVFLLKTALKPEGRTASGNEVTVIEDDREFEAMALADFDLVILANVARLSRSGREHLLKFVESGGGLVIFGGDRLEPDFYNSELYAQGKGPLPVALNEPARVETVEQARRLAGWDEHHPLTRPFLGPLGDSLRQVRFQQFWLVDQSLLPVAVSAPTSGPAGGVPVVLARFNDPQSTPAILEKRYGLGLCVLLTSTADQDWNDWAANFSYLPFMLELVQHVARPPETLEQKLVGETLACPLNTIVYQSRALLRTPAYPVDAELPLEAGLDANQRPALTFGPAEQAGLYRFLLTRKSGRVDVRQAAVNLDAGESDTSHVDRAELESATGGVRFEYVRDAAELASQWKGVREEWWWPLLWCAAGVLMLEQTLGWWFGRRG